MKIDKDTALSPAVFGASFAQAKTDILINWGDDIGHPNISKMRKYK